QTKVIVTFLEISAIPKNGKNYISNSSPYNDLDYLAGTWNQEDETEFVMNTKIFNEIEPNLW
ncbi:MAG TPA: hypothetical protein V6C58_28390, partial [Allocoleopsis sp.]